MFNILWNGSFKWAFLITICPFSVLVVVDVVVVVVVNFSHFQLLQNQTRHKSSFCKVDSGMFKWRGQLYSKGRQLQNSENALMKFKNILKNHSANLDQIWHKAYFGDEDSSLFKWTDTPIFKWRKLQNREIRWQNTKKSTFPEPLDQFQSNLAHCILEWRGFKFV